MFLKFLPLVFVLTSCTSFMIRQECDKINWYQHGQDIAMRGERISNDEMVMKCRRADAEMSESKLDQGFKAGMSLYCQPDTVFQTGKIGDNFNSEFCDTSNMNLLKKRHAEGVIAYCKAGLTAGLSGRKYKNICAADLEKSFMPEYRKGRKKYLSTLLQTDESKRRQLSYEVDRLSLEKRQNDSRLSAIPFVNSAAEDPYARERQRLSDLGWSLSSEISRKNSAKNILDKQIDDYQKELATLD